MHCEKTPAAKQCIMEAQTTMSVEVHQSHVLKGGSKHGRTVISTPEIPSPSPESQDKLDLYVESKK